jgi:meiotic recombination protein SPO11
VDLFVDQKNSDRAIEDAAVLLRTTRNSTHIIAGAKGVAVGRIKLSDKGQEIDLLKMGSGAWNISPFLDQIEIVESDADFVLVVEKEAAMIRLTESEWWKTWPCILLTGKGLPDIATRMFLKLITKELKIPAFCLVDSDPYGHYIYSVYLRGSKRLSYESPFLATSDLKLLGVLSRDLDGYNIPKLARLPMTKYDLDRTDQILKEPFVKRRKEWVTDIELMRKTQHKAEIQALAMHGFQFMTDTYLPEKLTTGDWI